MPRGIVLGHPLSPSGQLGTPRISSPFSDCSPITYPLSSPNNQVRVPFSPADWRLFATEHRPFSREVPSYWADLAETGTNVR